MTMTPTGFSLHRATLPALFGSLHFTTIHVTPSGWSSLPLLVLRALGMKILIQEEMERRKKEQEIFLIALLNKMTKLFFFIFLPNQRVTSSVLWNILFQGSLCFLTIDLNTSWSSLNSFIEDVTQMWHDPLGVYKYYFIVIKNRVISYWVSVTYSESACLEVEPRGNY